MTNYGWCIHCQNTGWLDCYCEGDMCGCENGGEYPCPHCDENEAWEKADFEAMSPKEAIASRKPVNAFALTERLIQAAVDYESGRCSRRELSEARAAVEAAITATIGG